MKKRFFTKYLLGVVVFSMLLGVMHHHNDLKEHSDCKICVVQSNILNGDTPQKISYVEDINHIDTFARFDFANLYKPFVKKYFFSRAPPLQLS